ncbi:MAG: hypothetical protein ACHREM_21395 [Polyangiales bacterium]
MQHHILYVDSERARLIQVDPLEEEFPIASMGYELTPRPGLSCLRDEFLLEDIRRGLGRSGGVLIVGPELATSQVVEFLRAHAPDAARRIVSVDPAEAPNDPRIVAHACRAFKLVASPH